MAAYEAVPVSRRALLRIPSACALMQSLMATFACRTRGRLLVCVCWSLPLGPDKGPSRTQIQVPRGLLCSCGGRAEQCGVCTGGVGVASRVRALRRGMLRCDGGGGATCDRNRGEAGAEGRSCACELVCVTWL